MGRRKYLYPRLHEEWGDKVVYLWPRRVRKSGHFEPGDAPKVNKDCTLLVCWPDGTISPMDVVMREYTTRVYDMGHEYDVTGNLPWAKIEYNGAEFFAPLESLDVAVLLPL